MSAYRKCLVCKEVKDKDSQFTIESWKCDPCVKAARAAGGGPVTPAVVPPAPQAAAPAQQSEPAPAWKPATEPSVPTGGGWGVPPTVQSPPKPLAGWGAAASNVPAPSPTPAPMPEARKDPTPPAPAAPALAGFVPPSCSHCAQPILGPALDAMQGKWHPDCFLCCLCGRAIKEVDFAIVDGKQAHEACRPKPLCCRCSTPIGGMILTALNAKWHEACFCCVKCEAPLAHQKFFIEEDDNGAEVPLCEGCTPKPEPCSNCGQPVDRGIVALDATWHPHCFVCGNCKKSLEGPFYPKGKVPYCSKECYLAA